jgi:hypothetical protein
VLQQGTPVLALVSLLPQDELDVSPLARLVGFQAATGKQRVDGDLRRGEVSINADGPMAGQRVLLRTHQCDPVALDAVLDPRQPATKRAGRCEAGVLDLPPLS